MSGRLHVRGRSFAANLFFADGMIVGADQSEHQAAAIAGDVAQRAQEICFELLDADRRETLKATCEAASNEITEEIFQFWSQNNALEVVIEIDNAKAVKWLSQGATPTERAIRSTGVPW